jgi:hypothetical protein
MSDKIKCSVCGKECDENHWVADFESFPVLKERFGAVYICTICYWTGFLKALGVKPKEKPVVLEPIFFAFQEPVAAEISINGVPLNPCDTLTRAHAAAIESEKKAGTYEPTLIPGCPADVAKRKES